MDLSEPLLELARASLAQTSLGNRVRFEKGDVQKMSFQNGWFDVVVSLNTFHVVEDPITMLHEIERVLSPGGRLELADIKRSWMGLFLPIFKTAYTLKEAQEFMKQSGLRTLKVYDKFFWFGIEACVPGEFLSGR